MSNKFKVGDTIRRISGEYTACVTMGYDYEVLSLGWRDGMVKLLNDSGNIFNYYERHFELVTIDNNSKETTAMTASKFTETVTTTKTTIKEVINGRLSNNAYISIDPYDYNDRVRVVVGARYEGRDCASFDKPFLLELINELQAVHDVMEDY